MIRWLCIVFFATCMGMQFVLYVGYDRSDPSRTRFCPGSRRAIELIDGSGLQDKVTVQSIDALRESMPLPEWLKGTPTLVCKESRKAMRGTAAIEHLRSLTVTQPPAHSMDGMIAPGESLHLGSESNFEPIQDDPSKYDDSRKISDSDLQQLIERRRAVVPA